jgi:hypothetical protein
MFKIGDTVIWTTKWGTLYLGSVVACFKDERGIPSLLCNCIGDDYVDRDAVFRFIAAEDSCKIWLGAPTKIIEEKILPPMKY